VRQTVLMRVFYSLFKVFVVVPFAPRGKPTAIPLEEIVGSNNRRRLRRSSCDVRKILVNDETISDHRSTEFRDAPRAACATPVFVALLIPAPKSNLPSLIWRRGVLVDRFAFGRFFAALSAATTANTCERRSAIRSRVPRVLPGFVFFGHALPAQIIAGSVFPYVVQIIWPTLGDKGFGSSDLLVTFFFLHADRTRRSMGHDLQHIAPIQASDTRRLEAA
jgi:hypothetical protein